MEDSKWSRREFERLSVAALSGLLAGAGSADNVQAAEAKSRLLEEPHVCRGLNTCKGKGGGGKNACAGQGQCATADAHSCGGQNACKGQGGCGAKPGENACKGMGSCSVPLHEGAWEKARKHFEAAMKKAGKKVGPAPKKKT